MKKSYYQPEDLKKFSEISEWNETLGEKFFDYYAEVFKDGHLSAREKSLIALAVSHVVQCPIVLMPTQKTVLKKALKKKK